MLVFRGTSSSRVYLTEQLVFLGVVVVLTTTARAWVNVPPLKGASRRASLSRGLIAVRRDNKAPENNNEDDSPTWLSQQQDTLAANPAPNPLLRQALKTVPPKANGKTEKIPLPSEDDGQDDEPLLYSPGPRSLFVAGAESRRAVGPPGPLAASKEADYEKWISGQLRLNRIQACSDSAKSGLVEKLRRVDLDEAVMEDLRQLVATGNGVFDKSASTLLFGQWDEVFPARLSPRRVRFEVASSASSGEEEEDARREEGGRQEGGRPTPNSDGGVRVERERQFFFLGPLLSLSVVFDAKPADADTLAAVPRRWGCRLKVFGVTLPVPLPSSLLTTTTTTTTRTSVSATKRLAAPLSSSSSSQKKKKRPLVLFKFLYVDSDLVVVKEEPSSRIFVLAAPVRRTRFDALLYGARRFQSVRRKKRNLRADQRRQGRRNNHLASRDNTDARRNRNANDDASFGIGDVLWQADTSMDVDDDRMQAFLDKPHPYKAKFSVQDMLDGNLYLDDDDDENDAPPSSKGGGVVPGLALKSVPPPPGVSGDPPNKKRLDG